MNLFELSRKDACLFMLASASVTRKIQKGKSRRLLYTTVMDYYLNNEPCLIVKEHPRVHRDDSLEYQIDAKFIDGSIPLEFYMLDDDFYLNKMVSVISTARSKVSDKTKKNIFLGIDYWSYFALCSKLYFAIKAVWFLISQVEIFYVQRTKQDLRHFFVMFMRYCFGYNGKNIKEIRLKSLDTIHDSSVVIMFHSSENILQMALEGLPSEAIAICLQEDIFISSHLSQYVVPFRITKKATGNKYSDSLESEKFYIFCKSELVRKKLRKFSLIKNLEYTQLRLSAKAGNSFMRLMRDFISYFTSSIQ
jgi:hypothetical protein